MPADAVPGSTIPEDTEAEILLQDGTWAWAQVTGQRKDRHGRWCVGLRWYASPAVGGREGWYLYDPAFIRRQNHSLSVACRCAVTTPSPAGWASVSGRGEAHTCGIRTGGTLWCWGWNHFGQLGIGNHTDQDRPQQVTGCAHPGTQPPAARAARSRIRRPSRPHPARMPATTARPAVRRE